MKWLLPAQVKTRICKGVLAMPLEYQHQVELLRDILTEHQSDCCGTVAECEQLERVIKSLMVNTNIHQDLKNVLQNIYSYSQDGKNSSELNSYITSQQNVLTQWIDDIDSFS
jgi:hypothetical protein